MAYCSTDEIMEMLKDDMINVILGDDYIEDPEERRRLLVPLAVQAADDAQAEIDGYLAKRYNVPFARTPRVLNKFSKDIALYNLVSRHGVDEDGREKTYLTRYNAAIAFLTKVAKGDIDIGVSEDVPGGTEAQAQGSFSIRGPERLFTRDSMRGW